MRGLVLSLLCAVGAAFAAAPAAAEVELQAVRWQQLAKERAQAGKPYDIDKLSLKPNAPLGARLVAKVKLLNKGPVVEGILLRYAVTAKIARVGDAKQPAVWSVPYIIEEKRVPKIGANQFLEATLDPTALTELYLRKLSNEGYWPVELKLQVLVEPRKDNPGPLQLLDSSLPVAQ